MENNGFLLSVIIYMSAAVILVPIFVRIGLGSVLGYLIAGIAIGPWGLGLIGNVDDILHFSELGVVLLLFIIGLELEPRKLWGMKKSIIGAGGFQVGFTSLLVAGIVFTLGFSWETAILTGLGLSLSSTAISLQLLNEKRLINTPLGKTGFSILLFQDISVVPIIALIPLLASKVITESSEHSTVSGLMIFGVFVGIFVVGRYALRHIFRFVASTHLPEIFTALSLLLVCGLAYTMHIIGVSMALGAFLGGVILADSEYRHALESDIQPFKGMLLGLFFISVGMSIDFGLLFTHPLLILGATLGLVALKSTVLYLIAWIARIESIKRSLFAFLFSQSGEFAFVLFGFAVTAGAMSSDLSDKLTLIVAMSMVITPILLIAYDRLIAPPFDVEDDRPMDHIDEDNEVILVGFGRFGQVIGRMLYANNINPTVIENNPDHIERVRRFGYKAYYGDVLKHDVLHTIGAEKAKLIILTGGGAESINQAIEMIQRDFPNLTIIARAKDRDHAMHLIDNGVVDVTRETFFSAVEMGKKTLSHLGIINEELDRMVDTYIDHDVQMLHQQVSNRHDEKALISIARTAREQLEITLEADRKERNAEASAKQDTASV